VTRQTVIMDAYEGLRREGYSVEDARKALALLGVESYELRAAVFACEFPSQLRVVRRPHFEDALQQITTKDTSELLRELEAADMIIDQLAGALHEQHIELSMTLRRAKRSEAIARAKV